jgi:flagellar basal-body rod modification protein FlgD
MDVGSVNTFGLPIELTTAASAQTKKQTAGNTETVSKDEFLQLLVAQLKNQDPIDPVKNENFLAQLASFSSLEQLVSIKEGIDKLAGITTDGTGQGTETTTQS